MPADATPRKTSEKIDRVIHSLNAKWDLQLPRLRGATATTAATSADVQRKCSSRIRALCWLDNVNIDSVLTDFEERAESIHTEWIFKPSQQRGTLPRFPVTKPGLRTSILQKSRSITTEQRRLLCQALLNLLEDEYRLANESDMYSRTSMTSDSTVPTTTSIASSKSSTTRLSDGSKSITSFQTARSGSIRNTIAQQTLKHSTRDSADSRLSKKRRALPELRESTKRPKIQPHKTANSPVVKTTSFFNSTSQNLRKCNSSTIIHQPSLTNVGASFDSEEPDLVFSQPDRASVSSNDTSILSNDNDQTNTQFSGATELEEEFENNISFRQSFHKAESSSPQSFAKQLEDIVSAGPFKKALRCLPSHFPYWYTYELYRASAHLGIDVDGLWGKIRSSCQQEQPTFDEFWRVVKELCKEHTPGRLLARSHLSDWTLNSNAYWSSKSGRSVSFTAKLNFAAPSTKRLFDFELNALKQDTSCRFHRRFGADRFMVLDVPYFDRCSLPRHIKEIAEDDDVHNSIFAWLTENDLHIAGRTWRVFWAEPYKSQSKKKRQDEGRKQRIHLFATDGFDFLPQHSPVDNGRHSPISILKFLEWHLPLDHNRNSKDLKLFSRMQLGLSKTEPTLSLEPHEFIELDDVAAQHADGTPKVDGTIMTDGCARISLQFAQHIWLQLGKEGDIPTAFQARISGAKGLWYVDYTDAHPQVSKRGFWIEIRPSQLKIKPHPRHRHDADEFTRTFEVVKYSKPCAPGHLNTQFISILENRKVPRSALKDLIESCLLDYFGPLDEAMTDEVAARLWRQMNNVSQSSREDISFCGAMPDGMEDEIDMMLEHGFVPSQCLHLTRRIKDLAASVLTAYRERLRIEVPHSTTVFCIPDPLSILKPGEIQLNFSQAVKHPQTGLPEMQLENMDVLVGRNPAYLGSDIQRVRTAYYHELRHYKNVVIFPVQGDVPLADILSGGDYDGDTITVIWDQTLVQRFRNYKKPALASKKTCGVRSQTRLIKDIFTVIQPKHDEAVMFLSNCSSFNGFPNLLGEVTAEHEKLVYDDNRKLTEKGPETLAALANYLVDAAKQGDTLMRSTWNSLKKSIVGNRQLPNPAYKAGSDTRRKIGPNKECVNIIDYLQINVIERLSDELLGKFHKNWTSVSPAHDQDLKALYNSEWKRAENRQYPEAPVLRKLLNDLAMKIKLVNDEWVRKMGKPLEEKAPDDYSRIKELLSEMISAIEPLDCDCDVRREFVRDGGGKGTRWSLLRASAMYYKHPTGAFAFKLAGDELCRLKSRARGPTWEMTLRIRNYMKADIKKGRKLFPDDEEDIFYDAES